MLECIFSKSKKEAKSCRIQSRVMVLVLHGPLVVLSKGERFQSNNFDSSEEKVDYHIYLNIKMDIFQVQKGGLF